MAQKQEFTKIKYSNITKLYSLANGFKLAFEDLYKQTRASIGIIQYADTISVAAVNGFFALELYLKLIYAFDYWENTQRCNKNPLDETQYPKGHELQELFNALGKNSKNIIYSNSKGKISKLSNGEVDSFSQSYSKDFAKWRYYFESSGGMKGNFHELTIILNAVYDLCHEYTQYKMYMPEEWIKNDTNHSVTIYQKKVSSYEEFNNLKSKELEDLIKKESF